MAHGDAVRAPMRHFGSASERVGACQVQPFCSIQSNLEMLTRAVVWEFSGLDRLEVNAKHTFGLVPEFAYPEFSIAWPFALAYLGLWIQFDVAKERTKRHRSADRIMVIRRDQRVEVTAQSARNGKTLAIEFRAGLPPTELRHNDIVSQLARDSRHKAGLAHARADADPISVQNALRIRQSRTEFGDRIGRALAKRNQAAVLAMAIEAVLGRAKHVGEATVSRCLCIARRVRRLDESGQRRLAMSQKLLRIEFDALCFRAEALHAGGGSARIFFLGGINRVCHAFWALAQLSDGDARRFKDVIPARFKIAPKERLAHPKPAGQIE